MLSAHFGFTFNPSATIGLVSGSLANRNSPALLSRPIDNTGPVSLSGTGGLGVATRQNNTLARLHRHRWTPKQKLKALLLSIIDGHIHSQSVVHASVKTKHGTRVSSDTAHRVTGCYHQVFNNNNPPLFGSGAQCAVKRRKTGKHRKMNSATEDKTICITVSL